MIEKIAAHFQIDHHNDEQAAADIATKLGNPPPAGVKVDLVEHCIDTLCEAYDMENPYDMNLPVGRENVMSDLEYLLLHPGAAVVPIKRDGPSGQ